MIEVFFAGVVNVLSAFLQYQPLRRSEAADCLILNKLGDFVRGSDGDLEVGGVVRLCRTLLLLRHPFNLF